MSGSINAHAPTTVTQTLCSVGFVGFAELGTERRQRPLSAASDPLNDDDMQAHVVDDLEVNGQLKPIVLLDNSHLDGLHRYAACRRLDLCVQFFEPPEGVDPVAIFNSRNLQHRRLKESQRAIAGADCNDWGPSDWSYQCEPAASFSEKALVAREVGASTETSKEVGAVAAKGTPAVEGGVCLRVSVMKTAVEISKLPASGHAAALVSLSRR